MNRDDFPAPSEGFVITHFLVVRDYERSRAFYCDVLGGQVVMERPPFGMIKLANGSSPDQQLHEHPSSGYSSQIRRVAFQGGRILDATYRSWGGDPVLHARS